MVLLTAAAVGVGGYAAYRGGEAAVNAGGRAVEDMKRNGRRREEQRGLNAKHKERSTRLTDLQNRISAAKSGNVTASTKTTTTASASGTSQEQEAQLQKDRFSSIKERYSEARGSTKKKKGGLFGKFKKSSK